MSDTAKVTKRNNALASVNRTRNKWGLGTAGSNLAVGNQVNAGDGINNLLAWLREAKSKSGSPQSIIGDVSIGALIQDLYPSIESSANNIYNYCACNGNCSGSCSGSCSSSCSGGCGGHCGGSCQKGGCMGT